MKHVFLDTNILIDYVQARAGGDDAKQLLVRGLPLMTANELLTELEPL